ncbi:MAG: hydantoinase/oxoprolinase family protein [Thermoleophilia bacterium]|nr:hydantoinase/oxoprolinase family protein [Thermoleophilia bacterium]
MSNIVGVDVGGTFTDVYYFGGDGSTRTAKAPTTGDTISGVIDALTQVSPASQVDSLAFGSTIATNALVQRKLAKVGVLTTTGFRDVLDIRRLWRRDLFGHSWDRPDAVVPRRFRIEAGGRIDWLGTEVEPLVEEDVHEAAEFFERVGIESVAVSFLFSYLNADHEQRAAEILRDRLPGVHVMLSSDVNPERSEYERTSTTAIAAGLAPVIDQALESVERNLGEAGLRRPPRVMKSNGGVMSVRAARERPVELVKSGPAGGASAGTFLSEKLGEPRLILIDIGGTTADASLIVDGRAVRANHDMLEWDIPLRVPVVDIRSVGAGGGSIAHLDAAGGLGVGPQSAGAEPGPVAYGKGGTEPTVTDAAIVSGLIDPDYFLAGTIPLDAAAAGESVQPIADSLGYSTGEAAAAIMHVAAIEMATLVREITVDRGLDPRDFALVAFGGAGPLFVGTLLEELDLKKGYVPTGASTLSAMGGAFADVTFDYVRSEVGTVGEGSHDLGSAFDHLLAKARVDISAEELTEVEMSTSIDMRYLGQWHELEMNLEPGGDLLEAAARFESEHMELWGHTRPEEPIEFTAIRVRALSRMPKPVMNEQEPVAGTEPKAHREVTFFRGSPSQVPVYERTDLGRDWSVEGPVIVEEPQTTTIVPDGLRLSIGNLGELVVER